MVYNRNLFLSACLTLMSSNVFAELDQLEEEWQNEVVSDELGFENEIADASMYPVISEECREPLETKQRLHHYVLYGEMLYLKPYMGGMPWTYVQDQSNNPNPSLSSTTSRTITEDNKTITMDFDFGFRIGVGFNTTWLNLENQLTWMRYHTQTSHSLPLLTDVTTNANTFNQPVVYLPFWVQSSTLNPPGQEIQASEKTKLHWDQIDWVFKIPLVPFKRVAFLPVLGVRGLISEVKSTQTQLFSAYGTTFTLTPPLNSSTTTLKEKFNAVGLVVGLDSNINFGWGFNLSALVDAAAVFGNMKKSNNTSTDVPVIPTTLVPQNYIASDSSNKFKPIFDAQVTLSWNWNFCKTKLTLNTHIGYEMHYMPRFLEFIRVTNDGDQSYEYDLTLQGLNAGIGLSF